MSRFLAALLVVLTASACTLRCRRVAGHVAR